MQEIVFLRAFLDSTLDRKSHGGDAHAIAGILRIEAGLKEIEFRSIAEGIDGAGRLSVQPQYIQAQPSKAQSAIAKLLMKIDVILSVKRVGSSASAPPFL